MSVRLLVGLGNPGHRYAATRHNAGFMVMDLIARRSGAGWRSGGGSCEVAAARLEGEPVMLAKPLTFMNRSGDAVADLLIRHGIGADEWLLVFDDVALPLGALRLRPKGSDGGHNGVASVIGALGTADFPRLRCGIRPAAAPAGDVLPVFVLSPFDGEERDTATDMIGRAADACSLVVRDGLAAAMVAVNTQ